MLTRDLYPHPHLRPLPASRDPRHLDILKSVTAFNLFRFFRADLIQSEASWKLSLTSDWLMPSWKNVNKLKQVTHLGSLL